MTSIRRLSVVGWALTASVTVGFSCARSLASPQPSTVALAGAPVVWRNWATQDPSAICDAEPSFLLDELTLVNSALQRFLSTTAGDDATSWPETKIAAVEVEQQRLPQLLETHHKNLALLERCEVAQAAGFPYVRRRGGELLAAIPQRTAALEDVIRKARAARALAAWKASVQEQREALRNRCRDLTRSPQLYFAWRDEAGVTHWKFCDGSEVTAEGGAAMIFDPSVRSIAATTRKFDEHAYLTAARAWPGAQVLTPPASR